MTQDGIYTVCRSVDVTFVVRDASFHFQLADSQVVFDKPPIIEWYCPSCSTDITEEDPMEYNDDEEIACEKCRKTDGADTMLLCDGEECSAAWHLACLPEPLESISDGDWYCSDCSNATGDRQST